MCLFNVYLLPDPKLPEGGVCLFCLLCLVICLEHHRCSVNFGWNANLKGGSERLSNSSKVTQLVSIKARDLKTHPKTYVFSTIIGFSKLCSLDTSVLIYLNRCCKNKKESMFK